MQNIVRYLYAEYRKLRMLLGQFVSVSAGGNVDLDVYRLYVDDIYLDRPVTTGGWARGLRYRDDSDTTWAGIGLLGASTSKTRLYMGHGADPWTTYGIGIDTSNDVDIPNDLSVGGDTYGSLASFSYSANWSDPGGSDADPGCYKHGNHVQLQGTIYCGASWSSGDTAVTLPSGYRPTSGTQAFPVQAIYDVSTAGVIKITIDTSGLLKVRIDSSVSGSVSLDGVSFIV